MFSFVTWGNIEVQPSFLPVASCQTPGGSLPTCQTEPNVTTEGGREILHWNWSTDSNSDDLAAGDEWTAAVQVVAVGPPVNVAVPIDACTTLSCTGNGSSAVAGFFTSAQFALPGSAAPIAQSFPLVRIVVVEGGSGPPQSSSPPSPPAGLPPPPLPVGLPGPVPVPVIQPILAPPLGAIGIVSLQAGAAGLLTAAFTRLAVGRRRLAVTVAVRSGVNRSAFDPNSQRGSERFARDE